MTALFIPPDAPFSTAQQSWLGGFLAGLASAHRDVPAGPAPSLTVTVLYGSQTGNCELLAEDLAAASRERGVLAQVRPLDSATPETLAETGHLLIITSTYGEGDMPDNAELFWDALNDENAPRLESLQFSVLGLGDTGYDNFCEAGKLFDMRLEQLGAQRLAPRVDCDVSYEDDAAAWIATAVDALAKQAPGGASGPAEGAAAPSRTRSRWSRKTPFPAALVANRVLSGPSSAKEIRHLELALGDSGIEYAAGDALAVMPRNDPALAEALVARLGHDAAAAVAGTSLEDALLHAWEIRTPSRDLIGALAERNPDGELAALVQREDRAPLENWLYGKDTLDLLDLNPSHSFELEELARFFRPLRHRAYSISSSPLASPDRIHLTVASVRHGADRVRGGVCSTFLADRIGEGDVAGIFLQPNQAFRLPEEGDRPVIMIGPGTGVAPFRAFLQERAATGARGKNWLFFGDQHRGSDFIYSDELEAHASAGLLTRLDLAFSRDQAQKVYVQTRMREQAAELFAWLEEGAYLYVCGDATRMAKDVDAALHEIVASQLGAGPDGTDRSERAAEYVNDLKRAKRYVRDVY
ncbi:diflavin oxidoreductase [Pseudactinotalea suaedae]|uniref:diflavin oxidoreductase n=1 Tax=Pseudactinotalea suaedae TaxID=1524924 RepID=UPI0012E0EE45|nr:flavodoxin domain-containing protein [Pseudactinotalea suaedae]